MNQSSLVHDYVRRLNLPEGHWVLTGSGVLHLHGISSRPIGDLDVYTTARLWRVLQRSGQWDICRPREDDPPYLVWREPTHDLPVGSTLVPVHAFFAWSSRRFHVDVPGMVADAEYVDGVPCVPLLTHYFLMLRKQYVGRIEEKHWQDLSAMDEYFDRHGVARQPADIFAPSSVT